MLTFLVVALSLAACTNNAEQSVMIDQHKKMAGELQNNRLYNSAIEEYNKALALTGLDNQQRANLNYLIARIYFEHLSNYEAAAAHYIMAKEYDPNGSFVPEASRKLVASLEKLGNITDARRQLSAAADLDDSSSHEGDVVVAKIAGEPVYLSTIKDRIADLSPETQKQLQTPEAQRNFMRQYVGTELIYNAAVREDYLSRPEIVKQKEDVLKRLVVEKYITEKVMPNIKVDTADIRNFYLANKDSRYGGRTFDSVKADVFMDYQSEKAEAAYGGYISRLAKAEKVEFYDNRIK